MKKKGINPFRFKQFSVSHDRCAMKVGTDAVLLGAWARVTDAQTILDIGTGSGILALMVAQRARQESRIDAVELAQSDFLQAVENVGHSPWASKITLHHVAIQEYESPIPYDLIVCNPPYFKNSLLPPTDARKLARHDGSLGALDLLQSVDRLLGPAGIFAVILPTVEGNRFVIDASAFSLYPVRQLDFYSRRDKPRERVLIEFGREMTGYTPDNLILYKEGDEWTKEYEQLTRDFYIRHQKS